LKALSLKKGNFSKAWVPDRREIIWINCNPQAGKEMRDIHPFLVLSPKSFNERTSLVIGLPMATAEYNSTNPFAVITGIVTNKREKKNSYVLCHQPKSFDWRARLATPHQAGMLPDLAFNEILKILNQIIQLA